MKYVVDAQLPRRLARWIQNKGIEATHTLDLPDQNETEDSEIIRIVSQDDESIVISKDRDFPEQRIIKGEPERLLWITTGNIANDKLMEIFKSEFDRVHTLFLSGTKFIEISNESMTIHE